jgi:hypothetical protein
MNKRTGDRCKNGHLVVPGSENAYEYLPGKYRCRKCHAETAKKYRRTNTSVKNGASLRKAMAQFGLELKWAEFEAQCARSKDWGTYEALTKILSMPLELLDVNMKALRNYLDVAMVNTSPGKDPLRDLNDFLAGYGKVPATTPVSDDLTF